MNQLKYFDIQHSEDGSTPSNTPSNKIKGTLSYSISNLEFSNKYSEEAEDENELPEPTTTYCEIIEINRNRQHNQIKFCNKLFCEKCESPVRILENKRRIENSQLGHENNQILNECLANDPDSDCYSCKCSFINVSSSISLKESNLGWVCEGHKLHK